MHDDMQYGPIQGQGHDPSNVENSAIFKGYYYYYYYYYYFKAHWYFIRRGVKTKQISEISGMVILRTRKLKKSWPGILS